MSSQAPATPVPRWARWSPVALVLAAHPRQAFGTALVLALVAAVTGRPLAEVGLVAATVLVGQAVIGWADDLTDRDRYARHGREHKPLAAGTLEPGTAGFAAVLAVLLLVPVSIANGLEAGAAYLASVAAAVVGDRLLHARLLSFVPWAVSYGLLPVFLTQGGWGGAGSGEWPAPEVVALAAALGPCVHVLLALPGLVADHEEGERSLPLRLALKLGTRRLRVVAGVVTAVVVVALAIVGRADGLG